MTTRFILLALVLGFLWAGCRKNDDPTPPTSANFEITFKNEYSPLQAHFAAYLTDEFHQVRAFKWLAGQATETLTVNDTKPNEHFDCTVVKMVVTESPGTGVSDTALTLTTYTDLAGGHLIQLRDLEYRQSLDLQVTFTGITSLDSIIVPDGFTTIKATAANNFTGLYHVQHTGQIWLRVRVNGEPYWRFFYFNNVGGGSLPVTLDLAALQIIQTPPHLIGLPFFANWTYQIEGLIDTARLQFLPLGDHARAPGGAMQTINHLAIFEPQPLPYEQGYRVAILGEELIPNGITFWTDHFYQHLPDTIPGPTFALQTAAIPANDLAATVRTVGDFDLVMFSRSHAGNPAIQWDVWLRPLPDQFVSYRLPEVPAELATQFPALAQYDFGNVVRAQAEAYEGIAGYDALLETVFRNNDPLWKPRAGLVGKSKRI